jgi:[ribosomal protein S5]-alanine N-acetyltransferase
MERTTSFNANIKRTTTMILTDDQLTNDQLLTNTVTTVTTSDWKTGLPVLTGSTFTLRELRIEDAASLLAMLTTEEVSRFISPPPTTVEGFERFIMWAQGERQAGNYVCLAVVPKGMTAAVGIFQLRSLDGGFTTAEWGFALGSQFWGTGIFVEGARMVVDFAVDVIGVHRLEARAAVANGRGNGALRKIGAVQEGVLRRSFLRHGVHHDQVLWGIVAEDWRLQRLSQEPAVSSVN